MCLINASFFRYERTSKLLSCKNKATPTLSEKTNSLKFYQCFLSYCFEIFQSPCKTLHYCTIINLKNFRFGQVSCYLRVLFPSWWKIRRFHVSNQCFNFLFKRQFLHCIRPPLFRCSVMALMAMIKLKWKSGWVKSSQIDLSVKPSNFKTVSFCVHFIIVKISVFQELVSM